MVHRKKTRINDIRTRFIRTSFFSLSLRSTEDHSTQQTWNEFRAREQKTPKERRRKNRKTVGEKNSVVMCCACFYIVVCVLLNVRCCCCCSMVSACVCVDRSLWSISLAVYCVTTTRMYVFVLPFRTIETEARSSNDKMLKNKCERDGLNDDDDDGSLCWVCFCFVHAVRLGWVCVWCRSIQSHCIPCTLYNTVHATFIHWYLFGSTSC